LFTRPPEDDVDIHEEIKEIAVVIHFRLPVLHVRLVESKAASKLIILMAPRIPIRWCLIYISLLLSAGF
jgi:hypothetical protein